MSATWNLSFGARSFDFTVPIVGLAAGVSLLLAMRPAPGVPGSEPARLSGPDTTRAAVTGHPSGSVSGIVLDANGDPIPGAVVTILSSDGEPVARTISGADAEGELGLGEFHVDQLPRGAYALNAMIRQSGAAGTLSRFPVSQWEETRVRVHIDLGY